MSHIRDSILHKCGYTNVHGYSRTILHEYGYWWIYRGPHLHAVIIPSWRVLREDTEDVLEFDTEAEAWEYARAGS